MVLTNEARNTMLDALTELLDGGGTIDFQNDAGVTVVELNLDADAFGEAGADGTPGVAAMNAVSPGTSDTGGTIVKAVFKSAEGDPVFTATCGVSGAEINLSSNVINSGDTLQISSFTLGMPAS